ncbi:hypothetical protein EON66_10135 [archaeon]|nr:MAG: hypothetical protein EON66_10135 [archaeon]
MQGRKLVFFEFTIKANWEGELIDTDGFSKGRGTSMRVRTRTRTRIDWSEQLATATSPSASLGAYTHTRTHTRAHTVFCVCSRRLGRVYIE